MLRYVLAVVAGVTATVVVGFVLLLAGIEWLATASATRASSEAVDTRSTGRQRPEARRTLQLRRKRSRGCPGSAAADNEGRPTPNRREPQRGRPGQGRKPSRCGYVAGCRRALVLCPSSPADGNRLRTCPSRCDLWRCPARQAGFLGFALASSQAMCSRTGPTTKADKLVAPGHPDHPTGHAR